MGHIEYIQGEYMIGVKLDGRLAGTIRKTMGGYAYFAGTTKRHMGEVFMTIKQVKQSLENNE